MRKPVHHALFLKCIEYTDDPFWHQQFSECANGKFPRGVRFKYNAEDASGQLNIRRQVGQSTTFTINDDDDPEKVYNLIQNIFKTIGISSTADDNLIKAEIETTRTKEICDSDWKKIRRKKDRQCMLMNYSILMGKKYGLTRAQTNNLYHTLLTGIAGHAIESKDIRVSEGNITLVKNIACDDAGRFYCVNKFKDDASSTRASKDTLQVKDYWDKCKTHIVDQNNKFNCARKK